MSERFIQNPILKGFNPDPSICRVEDDFYMVTSTFSYYPGIPVYHSRDLCSWEHIGYAFHRPDQLRLNSDNISGGLFAPTIRYHNGTFYVVVVNMSTRETLIVTAEDPAGEWSEAHVIPGIYFDPSLFWDDDGKAYLIYNVMSFGRDLDYNIAHREIDLDKMEFVSDEIGLWTCALTKALAPEASHMYKKDGWYYIMISEGGTEHYHAVTIARSRSINGPYAGYEGNPILTHRHLTRMYPICNVGHGDLVDLKDGSWYMVVLASRIYGGYHKNLGRETFIVPVIWEDEWPVVCPDTGRVEWTYPAPNLPECGYPSESEVDHFDSDQLGLQWNFLGTPVNEVYRIADSKLYLKTIAEPIRPLVFKRMNRMNPQERAPFVSSTISFVARRQQHLNFEAFCKMHFEFSNENETAGMCVMQNNYNQLRIEAAMQDDKKVIRVVKHSTITHPGENRFDRRVEGKEEILASIPYSGFDVRLAISADEQSYSFYAGTDESAMVEVYKNLNGSFLGSETAGGYVGAYVGMFASGNGADSGNEAAFDVFGYKGK
jgi:xylan 1,4-beta-xylosidase